MSWFAATSASDFLQRASASAHRLSDQAELQRLGEQVRASAQSLAEQGEAAIRDARDAAVGQASALGIKTDLLGLGGRSGAEDSDGPLASQFEREARGIERATGTAADTILPETLRRWETRLYCKGDASSKVLEALLESRALAISLPTLVRTRAGRIALRSAATAATGKQGKPEDKEDGGRALRQVLALTSVAPSTLLDQLLRLLADASSAEAHSQKSESSKVEASDQGLQWVLQVLSATFLSVDEARLRQAIQKSAVVEWSIQTRLCDSAPSAQDECLPVVEQLSVGDLVWGELPESGHWYRAKVVALTDGETEVFWPEPPDDVESGMDDEYLDTAVFGVGVRSRLHGRAVVLSKHERPAPAVIQESDWASRLETAEALGHRFRGLRGMCEQVAKEPSEQLRVDAVVTELRNNRIAISILRDMTLPADTPAAIEGPDPLAGTASSDEAILLGLQRERETADARVAALLEQREELAAKLKALDKELAAAAAAVAEITRREHEVRTPGGADAAEADCSQERFLSELALASKEVEALLARRAEEAAAIGRAAPPDAAALAASLLDADRRRRRTFEALVGGFHAALWGPDAGELVRDPVRLAAIQGIHGHGLAALEQAWKETVQLAAETLDDSVSEEMSRAARRYKEMRQELQAGADRLSKLGGGAPPPSGSASGGYGMP